MPRTISNPVHRFFTYHHEEDKSECNKCGTLLKGRHSTNLRYHMFARHQYKEKGDVIFEYEVESPKSPGSSASVEEGDVKTPIEKVEVRESRSSPSERPRQGVLRSKQKEKGLIEQLTKEKIQITALQKDLVEKELEEKNLKVQLLQEEMKHKNEMFELEKQEMLLRIEVLKSKLKDDEN